MRLELDAPGLKELYARGCRFLPHLELTAPRLQHLALDSQNQCSLDLNRYSQLQVLYLTCPGITSLDLQPLSSLHTLTIRRLACESLDFGMAPMAATLKSLCVSACPELTAIEGLKLFTALTDLAIRGCSNLGSVTAPRCLINGRIITGDTQVSFT